MTKLILIRHGQSKANLDGRFVGHIDAPLSDLGQKQAEASAKYVAENYKVDAVYASDLKRAYYTGKAVADLIGKEVIKEKNLREIYAGKWEGEKFDELLLKFPKSYGLWLENIGKSIPEDGESVEELQNRIVSAVKKIAKENDGKTVVIATHATPIRVFETFAKGKTLDEMQDIPWVSNASVSVVNFNGEKFICEETGYDAHLGSMKTALPKNV
jgi:broad specificity phosphatase PhoE